MASMQDIMSSEIAALETKLTELKTQYAALKPEVLTLEHTAVNDLILLWRKLFAAKTTSAPAEHGPQ